VLLFEPSDDSTIRRRRAVPIGGRLNDGLSGHVYMLQGIQEVTSISLDRGPVLARRGEGQDAIDVWSRWLVDHDIEDEIVDVRAPVGLRSTAPERRNDAIENNTFGGGP
jgi:hypothetical protein